MGLHQAAGGPTHKKGKQAELHEKGNRQQIEPRLIDPDAVRKLEVEISFKNISQLESLLVEILEEVKSGTVNYIRDYPMGSLFFKTRIQGCTEKDIENSIKLTAKNRSKAAKLGAKEGEVQGSLDRSTSLSKDVQATSKPRRRRSR